MIGRVWTILKEAGLEWVDDNATRLAASLAFFTILSIAPLLVIATAVTGFVLGEEAASGQLRDQVRGFAGEAGAQVLETTVQNADRPKSGTVATIVGVITLLFGASGVFGELQSALNTAWDVKAKPGRAVLGIVRDRFLSFGMVLVVGFLLLVSLFVSALIAGFANRISTLVPGLPTLVAVANLVISYLVVTALFALIFKFLPDAEVAWRDVWFGAVVTAALFTVGKFLIGLYLGTAGVATPFGAAGSVVAFVVWVYYSGLILFFGAELTQVVARRRGRGIVPKPNAMPADAPPSKTSTHDPAHVS
jgi:membrane protein